MDCIRPIITIGETFYEKELNKTLDVLTKELKEYLGFVVESVVNSVGVNINTASFSILSYVSGLTKSVIEKILKKNLCLNLVLFCCRINLGLNIERILL